MSEIGYIACRYLDASAVVKLIMAEPGHEKLKQYFEDHSNFYMTNICLVEALSVFKREWCRKKTKQDIYLFNCNYLFSYIRDQIINVDELSLNEHDTYFKTEELAKKYNLDISDALQIFTVKHRFKEMVNESKTIFITADKQLAKAAKAEGLRVWNCINGSDAPEQ